MKSGNREREGECMGCALVMAKIECLLGPYWTFVQYNRIYWNGKNVECKLNALAHNSTFLLFT